MELKDKIIVITGGSSGIGLEVVKQLCNHNQIIVLAHRSHLDSEMQAIHPNIQSYVCDLANRKDVESIADKILKKYPVIDILINNAAIQYNIQFLENDFSIESIEREIEINLVSVCKLSYLLLPSLLKQDRSLILNVNSGLGLAPKTNSATYCATKFAINGFSKSLGYQLENTNIRVLQAFMPLVDTPMTRGRGTGKISAQRAAQEIIKALSSEKAAHYIGKVKLLVFLLRLFPKLAENIMKRG